MERFKLTILASTVSQEAAEARDELTILHKGIHDGSIPEEVLSQRLDDIELAHIEALIILKKKLGEDKLYHPVAYGRSMQNLSRRLKRRGFEVSTEKGYYLNIFWWDKN
jgi:hypothetical protein